MRSILRAIEAHDPAARRDRHEPPSRTASRQYLRHAKHQSGVFRRAKPIPAVEATADPMDAAREKSTAQVQGGEKHASALWFVRLWLHRADAHWRDGNRAEPNAAEPVAASGADAAVGPARSARCFGLSISPPKASSLPRCWVNSCWCWPMSPRGSISRAPSCGPTRSHGWRCRSWRSSAARWPIDGAIMPSFA